MALYSFALEHLEDRNLFSIAAPLDAGSVAPTTEMAATTRVVIASHPLAGAFNAAGTYSVPFHNPDVGPRYNFVGHGTKASLGKFTLGGFITLPGFINNAQAKGRLTLKSSRGTITLVVHGPPQAPGSLPPSLSYSILKGSGAYANSTGKGHMIVSASDTTQKFVFRFNQTA
jgi:hypothetical protein